jgi:antitoxin YefM
MTEKCNFLYVIASWDPTNGGLVKTMTYSESRAHYAEPLNAGVDDREEVVITRAGHEPVVIVALADYASLKETAYLLRSPENDGGCWPQLTGSSMAAASSAISCSEARLG